MHFKRVATLFRQSADESLDLQMERENELIVMESVMGVSVDAHNIRVHEISPLDSCS